MAIDVERMCSDADAASSPQAFFSTLAWILVVYVALDTLIAVTVVRRKLRDHLLR